MEAEDYAAIEQIAASDPQKALELGTAWMRNMRRGDFARAWAVSDEVLQRRRGESCHHLPRHFQWVWNGEPFDGKRVLIRCYHGLGDTIQFIRYAPLVKRVASSVVVWAQPALIPLLRTVSGIDQFLPLHAGQPEVDYDIDVEIMELPHVFRSTVDTLPRSIPYLHIAPADLPRSGKLRVGLVWKCGDWAPERSIPLTLLQPLAENPSLELHILQRGPALNERASGFGIVSGSDDILAAARVVAALDLVISIDSMPAHLAGALGVATWTLLQANSDWRWMDDREDTPWYPTMRLFRQNAHEGWEPMIRRVTDELRRFAPEPSGRESDPSSRGRMR